ncbi:histidine phosphatase family protein [Rosenbergiella nectarea]|uniref:histidine phosphatase family protein n=1 Tax=Rosenbergiella nectarea TaxID=988801 RepID=UPI001BD984E0|nr:histidine phosphatase family protein [Rosenbergiella nectarea]MBT0728948.1 histidine phosphatase family protein [Rosenbergiella nectarea subsp. apis]
MRSLFFLLLLLVAENSQAERTFVFFRHAEKQMNFSGQLSCQGLNRALRLPEVLVPRYGKPDALYASAPIEEKEGSSVRAVATLMPIAIQTGESIGLQFHARDTHALVSRLLASDNHQVTYIAWEHDHLVDAVKELVSSTGGESSQIPSISPFDYDSIYLVKLDKHLRFKSFTLEKEGLNQLPTQCVNSIEP